MFKNGLPPFDFQPLTRVVFGAGILASLGEIARELGFRRTLVVSDRGVGRAGHTARGLKVLERAGIEAALFDGVEENPTTLHVELGLEAAKQHGVDSIVALGGGSAMDCAKGINFLLTSGGRMEDYWGVGKARKPMLPMIAVPTTAGTGSETQSATLIGDPATHQKMACVDKKAACKAAILDPELTLSMPPAVTAASGIDAISHAVESFVTAPKSPLSQAFAREAWRLLSSCYERVLAEPGDLQARGGMLLGASLAGLAIENSMLGAAHSLANPLTARFFIPHGVAIGLMLPHVVRFNASVCEAEYLELERLNGSGEAPGLGAAIGAAIGGAERLARRLEILRGRAGLPARMSERGVASAAFPALAAEAARQWTARFNPRPVTAAELEELYRRAF
ncbi:MAG: iron-containing alcohol dehydrogenase [Planctomycetes bacterium]|nr:iron-containing alcohol dehydrogenase [Planctomycetota bacterium]